MARFCAFDAIAMPLSFTLLLIAARAPDTPPPR